MPPSPHSPRPASAGAVALLDALDQKQRARLDRLAEMLIEANRHLNLTAVANPEGVRVRHLADSLAVLPLIAALAPHPTPRGGMPELVDLGSGGGFPGLALAVALPGWRVVSVEATAKKARFQESAVEALGLENVEVVCDRIEVLGRKPEFRGRFALATARALAALNVVAELALPLVAVGGRVLAWKGRRVEEELEAAHSACAALGGQVVGMVGYRLEKDEGQRAKDERWKDEGERRKAEGENLSDRSEEPKTEGENPNDKGDAREAESDLRIVVLQRVAACPPKYPRNAAAIGKRPLGAELVRARKSKT